MLPKPHVTETNTDNTDYKLLNTHIHTKENKFKFLPVLSWNRLTERKDPVLFWRLWEIILGFSLCVNLCEKYLILENKYEVLQRTL